MAVRNVWTVLTQVIVALVAVALVLFVMVLYWPLIRDNAGMRLELARLREDVREARNTLAENVRLRYALENDPRVIEREVRTRLRYARTNETIVVFVAPANPASAPLLIVP